MKSGYPLGDDLTLADIHAQELAEKEASIAQLEAELAAARVHNLRHAQETVSELASRDAALAAAHRWLGWALDLLDMYDQRVVDLGDPPELVHSEVHENGKRLAREALSAPALRRAAEELRLLRELEAALVHHREAKAKLGEAQDEHDAAPADAVTRASGVLRTAIGRDAMARSRLELAAHNLRCFREEQG